MKKYGWIVLLLVTTVTLYFIQTTPNQVIRQVNNHTTIGTVLFGMSEKAILATPGVIKDENYLFYSQYIHMNENIKYVFSGEKNLGKKLNEIRTKNPEHEIYGLSVGNTVVFAKKVLLDQDFRTFANETLAFKKGQVTIRLEINEFSQTVDEINLYILSK